MERERKASDHPREPALETIICRHNESFRWNQHHYPHHLAKWHRHPEYEIHLVRRTSGRMMVGDYLGAFRPGDLILTGPDLPHNWVSDLDGDVVVPDRDMLIQFTPDLVARLAAAVVEFGELRPLLAEASRGLLFQGRTASDGARLLTQIGRATGLRRVILLLELLIVLQRDPSERHPLSLATPTTDRRACAPRRLHLAMGHIHENFLSPLGLADVARLCHMEPSSFSRFFKRQSGHTFSRYVNALRVKHACSLLVGSEASITEICFASGFNNTANFNRQFVAVCGDTPSRYREKTRAFIAEDRVYPAGS